MQWHGCKVRPFLTLPRDKTHGQVQLLEYDDRRIQLLVTVFKVGKWRVGTSGCPLFLTVMSVHLYGALSFSHTRLRRPNNDVQLLHNYYIFNVRNALLSSMAVLIIIYGV